MNPDNVCKVMNCDNQTTISELTDVSDDNLDARLNELIDVQLSKFSADVLKEKCRDAKVPGFSKVKKGELVQLLKQEFLKMASVWKSLSRNDLRQLCKVHDIKNIANSKKDVMVTQLLSFRVANLMLEPAIDVPSTLAPTTLTPAEPSPEPIVVPEPEKLSLVEQLERQKQELEQRIQEEFRKKEEEDRRLAEEEEKKRLEAEKKEATKKKKQTIPKNVRMIVWGHYIGEDIIKHKCLCCKKVTIANTNFEVGHVISEKNGGSHEINNLRPICFACNHSMGSENMVDFVVKYGLFIG